MTHEWKVGEWYKTRGGYEAQVFDVNYKSERFGQRIVGKIKRDDADLLVTWWSDGTFVGGMSNQYDLLPPVERKELWVEVYDGYTQSWSSKESVDKRADHGRVGLLRITIDGDDFTVEKVTV
jgi:hypothetical protein